MISSILLLASDTSGLALAVKLLVMVGRLVFPLVSTGLEARLLEVMVSLNSTLFRGLPASETSPTIRDISARGCRRGFLVFARERSCLKARVLGEASDL